MNKQIFTKYREMMMYLFFGVLTTLVNILSYWFCFELLSVPNVPSSMLAQVLAILFAFVTNKLWVFDSRQWIISIVAFEIVSFFGCRFLSAAFDVIFMWVTVDLLSWHAMAMKILSNVVVVIVNYIASKFFVFKKK